MSDAVRTSNDGGFEPSDRQAIRHALLAWFGRNRRELPWRGVADPYAVWVSEIMLQQTQVATVIDYYERWMQRFPSVEALAEAEREEVLEMWAGLGYYRRARFLHESARRVVDERDGRLPETAEDWKDLKGIGPYTAGAIASIAYNQAVPVVDGNVERVLSRLCAIEGDPKSTSNQKRYWRLAGELVDPDEPGDFNEAMMELGATVCTPHNPACMLCPLREHCRGFAAGNPADYPEATRRTRQKPMSVETAVVTHDGPDTARFLVVKRPPDGLLAGLWEFPSAERSEEDASQPAIDRYLQDELTLARAERAQSRALGEIVHHFSHIRMTLHVEERTLSGAAPPEPGGDRPTRWVTAGELEEIAMSAAMRKVLRLFQGQ